ncbi:reverse transcriptase [Gossypium australe]|uniref:Reverse transcriptase n=1 Tax=Gossypium australe TaxID=47621 RepID=A0A5B6VN78_9ROSI|nr:reverse transcriptase [Gossypium australe]
MIPREDLVKDLDLNLGGLLRILVKWKSEDNVLLAYEILHTFKNRRSGRKGFFAIKLDMSKAYDRVEWNFIRAMMNKMGFATQWVDFLFHCISSKTYSININELTDELFKPLRRLRQGDPLSPYLFLICSEGLSTLVRLAKEEERLTDITICRRALEISHFMFADDCILFGEASNWGTIISNSSNYTKELVSQSLGVRCLGDPGKYLGLSNMVGRGKKRAFQNLNDRMVNHTNNWCIKPLSQDGKEGWRLLNYPESLLACPLAKYYHESDFMGSRLGPSPLYTWKII